MGGEEMSAIPAGRLNQAQIQIERGRKQAWLGANCSHQDSHASAQFLNAVPGPLMMEA